MSLAAGRKLLSIPGPTTVPDEVLQAMHRPAIDIYAGELEDITHSVLADLKRVFRTDSPHQYIYIANGHGAWEAALTNTLSRGDKILVLESGRFAVGWGEMGAQMGLEVEILPGRERGGVDPAAVEARLRADAAHEIQAVLVVQIDTASGVWNDIAAIGQAVRAAGHPALFMVDAIASLGCVPFEMDAWGVDLALTGSQKGLMTPPGLSFVAANQRARDRLSAADLRTRYWDWEFREGKLHYEKYCGTPPEHLLFGLRRALDMLLNEEGLEAAFARHAHLAAAARAAVAEWEKGGAVSFNILNPAERSDTVTTILTAPGYPVADLRAFAAEQLGVTLGSGIGKFTGGAFRIAHMGHANAPSVMATLSATEIAFRALGWPIGEGALAAAATRLAEAVAPAARAAAE